VPDLINATVLRALVIVALALCIGAVLAVLRLHYRAWRALPGRAGLTPLHVLLVSLGVLLLQGTLAWALIEGFTRDITPVVAVRTALYGVASVIILAALFVVGGLQRRKVGFGPRCTTVTVRDEATVQVRDEHATTPDRNPNGSGIGRMDRDTGRGAR
jgi:hypothetical protein